MREVNSYGNDYAGIIGTAPTGDPSARTTQQVSLDALLGEVVEDSRIEADARRCKVRLDEPDL